MKPRAGKLLGYFMLNPGQGLTAAKLMDCIAIHVANGSADRLEIQVRRVPKSRKVKK